MAKDLNVSLGLLAEQFKRGLKQATRDLKRFSRKTESIGRSLTNSLSIPLAGAGLAAIKSAADFSKLRSQLEATTKSVIPVAEQISRLKKIAEQPGLGFEQAVKASARLQALNLSAEQAETTITAFGKAVARSGGGAVEFEGAITALGQIISKGKISAEEINQLNERIFEIRPALEAAFGTSNSEELQKLGISAEEFVSKVTKEFSKLPPVQQNLFTAFENLAIGAKTFFAQIGDGINEIFNVQGAIEKFTSFLGSLGDKFTALDPNVKRTILQIAGLALVIGPVILGISGLASGLAVFLNPIGLVVTAIAALAAGFIALYNNNEAFRNGVQKLGGYLKAVFITAIENISSLFTRLRPILSVIRDNVVGLIKNIGGLKSLGVPSINALISGLQSLGQAAFFLYKVFTGVRVGIIEVFRELVTIAKDTVASFQNSFAALKEGRFKDAFSELGQGLKNLNPVSLALSQGKNLAESFLGGFKDGFNNDPITAFFNQVNAKVKEQAKTTKAEVDKVSEGLGQLALPGAEQTFTRKGDSEPGPRDDFSTITSLPSVFETVLPQAEQLKLITEALGATPLELFPTDQLSALKEGVKSTRELQEAQEKYNKKLSIAEGVANTLWPAFDKVFDTVSQGGTKAFKVFSQAIKQVIIDLGKAVAKAFVFAAIKSIITGGTFEFGNFIDKFSGISGLFGNGSDPFALANGGIIPNRTFLTGEEGAEAIIPLDRETNIPVRIEVDDIRIPGTDIILALRQSEGIAQRLFG